MKLKTLFLAGSALLFATTAQALNNKTITRIRDRGVVVCGTDLSTKTLAYKEDGEFWHGIDTSVCRNFAFAIFNNEKAFKLVDVSLNDAPKALKSGNIDLMLGIESVPASQEISSPLAPVAVSYYDRLVFATREPTDADSMEVFKGASVCVADKSADREKLKEYNDKYAMEFNILPFAGLNALKQAFFLKRCKLICGSEVYLKGLAGTTITKNNLITVLPEVISYRPVYVYTAKNDTAFQVISRRIAEAPQLAEKYDISSQNIETFSGTRNLSIQNLLGIKPDFWQSYGLHSGWVSEAIKHSGNFAEMYERNLGQTSDLKIERGKNKPIEKDGLFNIQPFI